MLQQSDINKVNRQMAITRLASAKSVTYTSRDHIDTSYYIEHAVSA